MCREIKYYSCDIVLTPRTTTNDNVYTNNFTQSPVSFLFSAWMEIFSTMKSSLERFELSWGDRMYLAGTRLNHSAKVTWQKIKFELKLVIKFKLNV